MKNRDEKYVFVFGGTKVAFTAKTPEILISSVQEYARHRQFQISDDEIAQKIAKANGYKYVDGIYAKEILPAFKKPHLNLAAVKSACGAMIQTIKGNTVPDQEIARRWYICQACPAKTTVSDCMSCGGAGRAADWINKVRGAAGKSFRLDQESAKTFCGLCGCSHALLIPTKIEHQKEESEKQNKQRPLACWLRYDSPNYIP